MLQVAGKGFMASISLQYFETAIADAERLLALFDKLSKPEQQANEVLKRAALIMTLTAWETYIEAWLNEQLCHKLAILKGSFAGDYIQKKLDQEIKRLNNPNAEKVRLLSLEFLHTDITVHWAWNGYQPKMVFTQLNSWLSKRGDIVHQGRNNDDPKIPHLVKRDEAEKAIRFFKELVKVTDAVLL